MWERKTMKPNDTEQLFMLRLWQEKGEGTWRASLKKIAQDNEAAQYFHTLESLVRFLRTVIKETKGEK
jgi:hypothetical protein